jgi:23S rRNA (adenine2503-C2)-methyltransferase
LEAVARLRSSDGQTQKTAFRLSDGKQIETVAMRYTERVTLCISSQAGCAMGCVFCATGQMGFKRHLTSGEIVAQVLHYARELKLEGLKPTNVVIMGMGEPFHNYDNTMAAVDRLNDATGFNFGARRFTISTVGLPAMIRRFADEQRQANLAVSLHAADDVTRSRMLPINRKYSIDEVLDACRYYVQRTHRRVTFEWALIDGENDGVEHATLLAGRLRGLLCHVNAIPLNPTMGYSGKATSRSRALLFKAELERRGIPCTVRLRRGIDIAAGCGQLAVVE